IHPSLPPQRKQAMTILCNDGDITDDDVNDWDAGPLHLRVALTRAQVRAMFVGTCLARGVAMLELSPPQLARLFPELARRRHARTLRRWAERLHSPRVRAVLATASWHQLRAAAAHTGEEAQIRAAFAHSLHPRSRRRRAPRA